MTTTLLAKKINRYVLKCLQNTNILLLSNNISSRNKIVAANSKKKRLLASLFFCFCLRVLLNLRNFWSSGQPHSIIYRNSSFFMVGLVLRSKFLISEKIPKFWSFGTIFSDGGSSYYYSLKTITLKICKHLAKSYYSQLPKTCAVDHYTNSCFSACLEQSCLESKHVSFKFLVFLTWYIHTPDTKIHVSLSEI